MGWWGRSREEAVEAGAGLVLLGVWSGGPQGGQGAQGPGRGARPLALG